MEKRMYYIQILLTDKLDQYKEKGNKQIKEHIRYDIIILELSIPSLICDHVTL